MNESTSPIPSVADYAASESPISSPDLSVPPTSVEPAPLPPKKKKHLLLWLILLPVCLLLVLAIAAGGVVAYLYTRPEAVLKGAIYDYLGGFVQEDDLAILDRMAQADQKGKIHLSIEQGDLSEEDYTVNLYSNREKSTGIADLAYGEHSLKWYVSPDQWILSGSMTGNEVLGVKPQGTYEQYKQSVFGTPDRSSASIVLDQYEEDALEKLLTEMETNHPFADDEDTVNYTEKYLEMMIDLLAEHSTATVSSEKGVQTNTYQFTPDGLNAYMVAILDEMRKDIRELEMEDVELDLTIIGEDSPSTILQVLRSFQTEMENAIEQMREHGQTATLTITSSVFPHALQSIEYAISPAESTLVSAPTYTLTVENEHTAVLVCTEEEQEQMRVTFLNHGGVRGIYVDELDSLQKMQRTMELVLTYAPEDFYEIRYFTISEGIRITLTLYGKIVEDTEDAFVFTLDQMNVTAARGSQGATQNMKMGVTVGFYPNEEMPEFPAPSADLFALSIADVSRIEQNCGYTIDELEKQIKAYLDDYKAK